MALVALALGPQQISFIPLDPCSLLVIFFPFIVLLVNEKDYRELFPRSEGAWVG